ncbi:MAG: hypothetical protein AB7O48_16420, partial [Cyclobacteriaceae bacterium]
KIRVVFGAREKSGGPADIHFMDVDPNHPADILHFQKTPVLSRGTTGCFDQDGVLPVCVKKADDRYFLYYGGFSKLSGTHFCMMGLAISDDNCKTFSKLSEGPVLPISRIDPFLIGSADIVLHKGIWHMIYTSGTKWSSIGMSTEISYTLKYSFSKNGIDWSPTGQVIFPQEDQHAAYAKPSIFRLNDKFIMYFSKRQIINYRQKGHGAYALGFATSNDLVNWSRDDSQAGIEVSDEGWDSEMICYPNIIDVGGRYLMFYNGNGFGQSGIGFAELEK